MTTGGLEWGQHGILFFLGYFFGENLWVLYERGGERGERGGVKGNLWLDEEQREDSYEG